MSSARQQQAAAAQTKVARKGIEGMLYFLGSPPGDQVRERERICIFAKWNVGIRNSMHIRLPAHSESSKKVDL